MSSLPAPAALVAAPSSGPVRHGSARLEIVINGVRYKVRRSKPALRGARVWSLTAVDGPRPGRIRSVLRYRGEISCTCEDFSIRGSKCKHLRALVAVGLLSGRDVPFAGRVRYPAPAPSAKGGA